MMVLKDEAERLLANMSEQRNCSTFRSERGGTSGGGNVSLRSVHTVWMISFSRELHSSQNLSPTEGKRPASLLISFAALP